jgi:tetratricopeptide (TPR) repeat protein
MFDIFINYRTVDARFGAAATFELLAEHVDRSRIFLDNQSMRPGSIYPERIQAALESMRVLVVLIGPNWLTGPGGERPLLHRDDDWVRREIRTAIERAVPIVPVLLDGIALPDPDALPADIRPLAYRQVAEVCHQRLGADVGLLADRLAELVPGVRRSAAARWTGGSGVPVPRELPASTAHFVGRDSELELLERLFLSPSDDRAPPIVVVCGTAGVGKTALAVQWAHRRAAEFPDGQLYADLRGFGPGEPLSPMEVLSGFLRAFGVVRPEEFTGLAERSARFRTLTSGRRVVIVLDNAHSAQQVEPLLPGAGSAVVLITSRELLGEMHIRHAATLMRLAPLSQSTGVRLLAASVGERVMAESAAADRLVSLCSGLPLALRIVAERLVARSSLTVEALAVELADERSRLASLSSLSAATDIRAVFSWSYGQLSPMSAAVFRAIGLGPRRGFGAPAISAIAVQPVAVVERAMTELSRAHLITELADGRYGMHDLLRTYAKELAHELDDPTSAARRLFEYYLNTAEHADRVLTPHRVRIPLVGDPEAGQRFTDASAARHWLLVEEPNLVALSRLDEPSLDTYRWQLAYVLRTYFYLTKQLDGWIETHSNALAAAIRSGNIWAEAVTRNNLGMAMTLGNRLDEAMGLFRTAKDLFDRLGDGHGTSNSLANIASVLRRRGAPALALMHQREALAHYRRTGAMGNIGITLRSMASAHLQLGEAVEAVRCAQEAIDIATWLSYELDIAQATNTLGAAYRLLGDLTLAEISYRQALELARRCASRFEEARALRGLGTVALTASRLDEAGYYLHAAQALYEEMGSPLADSVCADLKQIAFPLPEKG